MSPTPAPYGTWASSVSPDIVVENSVGVSSVFVDPVTSSIYHIESRPVEAGRSVIVDTAKGIDVFGPGWSASTRVGEYGGGAATAYGGVIYFSNSGDLRVYRLDVANGGNPVAVTPVNRNHRFADFTVLPTNPRILFAVLEDHTRPSPSDVKTSLVLIDTFTDTVCSIVSGADFYSSLRFSPDGKHAVWKQWYHPNMPWDGNELYVARVRVSVSFEQGENIELVESKLIGGAKGQVSASYPFWVSNETVHFTNNSSGHRVPWSYSISDNQSRPVLSDPVEMAFSLPSWFLGGSYGAVLDEKGEEVVYSAIQNGSSDLYHLDMNARKMTPIASPYVEISHVRSISKAREIIFVGGRSDGPLELVSLSLASLDNPSFKTLKSLSFPTTPLSSSGIISVPQPVTIKASDGGLAHLNFYPPKNPEYSGGEGAEKPPCVFNVHGGPAMSSNRALNWMVQYFTSRGWAWVDVNYRGSSGYGKRFLDGLQGQWGISVTRDCVQAAQYLAGGEKNLIDLSRIFIRGNSAGGYSSMMAISYPPADIPADFKWTGATSVYGISDLRAWADDMHKFQRMYVSWLIGGSYEEIPQVYVERSPITHVNKIKTPLLLIHGSDDAVVLPSQSDRMHRLLKVKGKKVEYVLFKGEGHKWTKAEYMKAAIKQELNWYEQLIKA